MVGTFGDVVIADAIVKRIGGFDENAAWEALKKVRPCAHTRSAANALPTQGGPPLIAALFISGRICRRAAAQ